MTKREKVAARIELIASIGVVITLVGIIFINLTTVKSYAIPQNEYSIKVYSSAGNLVLEKTSSVVAISSKDGMTVDGENLSKISNVSVKQDDFFLAFKQAENEKKSTDTAICFAGKESESGNSVLTIYTKNNEKIATYTGDIREEEFKWEYLGEHLRNSEDNKITVFEVNGEKLYVANGECILEKGVE